MNNFKHIFFFAAVVSIFAIAFSSCHREKTTKWRCTIPGWMCNVELTVDNATDLAHVTVNYAEGHTPNPHNLFRHNTTYKKIGDTFRRINPATSALESPGFVITYLSYEYMDLEAVDYRENDYDSTVYKTMYYFTRVF